MIRVRRVSTFIILAICGPVLLLTACDRQDKGATAVEGALTAFFAVQADLVKTQDLEGAVAALEAIDVSETPDEFRSKWTAYVGMQRDVVAYISARGGVFDSEFGQLHRQSEERLAELLTVAGRFVPMEWIVSQAGQAGLN